MRKALTLAAVLLLAPAVSQAKTLEDLLVEKGVITKGEARGTSGSAQAKVYWNNGTRFEFPDSGFTTGFQTLLQERYTFTDNDQEKVPGSKDTSSFAVNKARLIIQGTALHNEFSYYVQNDFVGNKDSEEATNRFLDGYVTWHACDWAELRAGQFKTFLGRQFNSHDAKLQFPDRSLASEVFDLGRQQGASGALNLLDDKLMLRAGIFNGLSDGEGINRGGVDPEATGTVEARWSILGEMDPYEEGDVENTEDAALNIGASYAITSANNDLTSDTVPPVVTGREVDIHQISADANFKYQGFSFHGEFFWASFDSDTYEEKTEPVGFYAQAGYFLMPKKLEIAGRYSLVDCDKGASQGPMVAAECDGKDQLTEATGAVSYYWWKHHLKASLFYTIENEEPLADGSDDISTNKWGIQLSQWF